MNSDDLQNSLNRESVNSLQSRESWLTSVTTSSSDTENDEQRIQGENTNVFFGPFSLSRTSGNAQNTAFGFETLKNCTVQENTAVGFRSLYHLTTAYGCTATGYCALSNCTERNVSDDNTAFGHRAGMDTNASGNSAFGSSTLLFNVSGNENTALGAFASVNNITGSRNTCAGYQASYGTIQGDDNTVVGHNVQRAVAEVSRVTALGSSCLLDNHSSDVTAVGYHSQYSNQTGERNVSLGACTLESNVSGSDNTALGHDALQLCWGSGNTGVGSCSLSKASSTGSENTGVGAFSLQQCAGQRNTGTGFKVLQNVQFGHLNTGNGYMALNKCTGGAKNTAVGGASLGNIVNGQGNVALGCNSGPTGDFDDTIALGAGAKPTQSGEFALGSAQHPLLTVKQAGGSGDASALPDKPQLYLNVLVNGELYLMPLYKPPQ